MTSVSTTAFNQAQEQRESHWVRVLCVLFFFSGFPALIYQLVWQRALFRILGVNIESVTIVVTAFMIGLGLGSLMGGWLSKRQNVPLLLLLAVIELLTAGFGLASLNIFDAVGSAVIGMPLPVTALATLGLVIVPTLLMGATLPLLVSHFVRRLGNVGSSVGLLYYVNTLGAGAACLFCVVLLFPLLGMQWSVYVAAAVNGTVALGAIGAYLFAHPDAAAPTFSERTAAVTQPPVISFPAVLVLASAGGFISLSYEIFFFRTMSYATGSSSAAFAAILGAFLIGLASGARQGGEYCKSMAASALVKRVVTSLVLANLIGFLFLPLMSHMAWLDRAVLGLGLLLVYLLARWWGVLLPCLAQLGVAADERAGMRTGQLYLANITGSAAGTVVTGFLLMDHLTLIGLAQVLVASGLIYAALLIMVLPVSTRTKLARMGWTAGFGVLAVLLLPMLGGNVLEALLYKGSDEAKVPFVDVVENRSGIITVDRSGTVFGNGIYDGHFNTDLVNDNNGIVRPYALSLFHPAPRDVLLIGFSSGSWAQVIANNPEVRSLTVVEINPGYQFIVAKTPLIASVLTNPKVTFVIDDGRRWLRLNPDRRFDAIVSNTSYHFRANATNLLSAEFLGVIKTHLNPHGVFFYNTTSSNRVQRTGCLAFPFGARFTNNMVLSSSPLDWDIARWRRVLEAYRVDGRYVLDRARAEDRAMLKSLIPAMSSTSSTAAVTEARAIEPCAAVVARTEGEHAVTDDNMGTEWRYGWGRE